MRNNSSSAYSCMTRDVYILKTNISVQMYCFTLMMVMDWITVSVKQQEKYCVPRAKIFTSSEIELNPGPVNGYMIS